MINEHDINDMRPENDPTGILYSALVQIEQISNSFSAIIAKEALSNYKRACGEVAGEGRVFPTAPHLFPSLKRWSAK